MDSCFKLPAPDGFIMKYPRNPNPLCTRQTYEQNLANMAKIAPKIGRIDTFGHIPVHMFCHVFEGWDSKLLHAAGDGK